MALKIRLARGGSKKHPFYRIVVAEASSPRDGRFVERLGSYDPMVPKDHENRVSLKDERIKFWMSKGAKPINIKLSRKENKISKLIAKDLKKENIFFAGIDFIDQKLNGDINVTSPTGLKTHFDLSGINLAKIFWKELGVWEL